MALSRDDIAQLGEAIALASNDGRPKKVHPSRYKPAMPWHPDPSKPRKKMTCTVYQHGHRLNERQLSNEQIELLNQLQGGRYFNRKIEVNVQEDSEGKIVKRISYPYSTEEQRMEMASYAPTLTILLQKILSEGEAQVRAEDAQIAARVARGSRQSAASA